MGNKMMGTRAFVEEQYTRPQAFFDPTVLDYRKLRRLILNGQLAPCFPGGEECTSDLDECPICFLNYPSLNRSKCCSKAICTECYLQIKSSQFDRSAQCPFCKTSSYTVEFRGAKTAKEKGIEQAEEQKVIEAKIKIRQKELHDEAERARRLKEDTQAEPFEHEGSNTLMESGISAQAAYMRGSLPGSNRTEGYLDMEDLILMEALSLSIQEQGPMHQEFDDPPRQIPARLAGRARRLRKVVAARAKRQATGTEIRGGDQFANSSQNLPESDKNLTANSPECRDLAIRACTVEDPLRRGFDANGRSQKDSLRGKWRRSPRSAIHGTDERNGWSDNSKESSCLQREGRDLDQSSSQAAEAGTSFSSNMLPLAPEPCGAPDGFLSSQSQISISGETSLSSALEAWSFEDQIMLAIALSEADAQEAQGGQH